MLNAAMILEQKIIRAKLLLIQLSNLTKILNLRSIINLTRKRNLRLRKQKNKNQFKDMSSLLLKLSQSCRLKYLPFFQPSLTGLLKKVPFSLEQNSTSAMKEKRYRRRDSVKKFMRDI